MRCPQCGERETRVVDSRDLDDSATIRRRRECAACAMRFTTYERVEAARLIVVKRDGARQEFDRDRLVSGLRKALTRRPVPDGAAEAGRGRDRSRAPCRRRHGGPVVAHRRTCDGAACAASTRSPTSGSPACTRASRTSRHSSARWTRSTPSAGHHHRRPAPQGARPVAGMSVLSDRDIRAALEAGTIAHQPVRPARSPAVVGRPPPRQELPRLPQQPLRVHRRPRPAAGPDRAADRRRGRAVHPAPGRVRPRPDARVGRAAERPRRQARRQELARASRPAHPLHRGLRRPGLEGQPDARAVERREPADRAVLRDAHRPDQLLQDVEPGRPTVWFARARVEVPGPVGADRVGLHRDFDAARAAETKRPVARWR